MSDPVCGDSGAVSTPTKGGGPNGSQAWLNWFVLSSLYSKASLKSSQWDLESQSRFEMGVCSLRAFAAACPLMFPFAQTPPTVQISQLKFIGMDEAIEGVFKPCTPCKSVPFCRGARSQADPESSPDVSLCVKVLTILRSFDSILSRSSQIQHVRSRERRASSFSCSGVSCRRSSNSFLASVAADSTGQDRYDGE